MVLATVSFSGKNTGPPFPTGGQLVFPECKLVRAMGVVVEPLRPGLSLSLRTPGLHGRGGSCAGLAVGQGWKKAHSVCAPGVAVQGCRKVTVSEGPFDL